ncbi:MAG: polysaccharide pyruvyl transferase CsaB [Clostridiales bacterium]|nr:polysaccharide pyruvyl transferase CsaB [Clostridiales bacterium]
MKIIHLIGGGDVGGAKTHVLSLIKKLSEHAEVRLISFRAGEFAEDALKLGIDVRVIHNKNPIKDIKELCAIIREGGYEIIHCHGAKANVMGAIARRIFKIPAVTTVHSDYRLDYMGSILKQCTNGALNAVALRFLDSYIGVTDSFADMLIKRGFDPYHVYSLYNGIDFDIKPSPKTRRDEYLNSLGVDDPASKTVCGIAARFHPVKDIATIIKAFAIAVRTCPDLRLIIGGDGEQAAYLKGLAAELKLEDKVFFPGWVTDMDTFLNALDINLLSSLSESFPYSVLEAVKSGCAMICTAVGGMPVLIDHGANGFLFAPQDIDALSSHLEYMYLNPEKRRDMARLLYEKASRQYSLDSMVARQLEIYSCVKTAVKVKRGQVTICGSYGRGNAGDDAILKALIGEINETDKHAEICVMSRNPLQTKLKYRVRSVYTFNVFKMIAAMLKSHLYLNGGGSLIQDSTSSRSLYFYLFTIVAARLSGCRVMMYGCGIGPVRRKLNRRASAWVINRFVDRITLRDPGSVRELAQMGATRTKTTLAADPTLNLAPADESVIQSAFFNEGLDTGESYMAVAMRNWKDFDKKAGIIAAAADFAHEKYGLIPLLVPMERKKDMPVAEHIAGMMKSKPKILRGEYDVHAMIGILSKTKLIVAMRLHALIFGAGQCVPVIGISYDDKVRGFMDYIGYDLCVPYEDLNFDILKGFIDAAYGDAEFTDKFKSVMLRIRENEKENINAAKEFFNLKTENRHS